MMLLGVDIGGTKIAAGIVDGETGAVLHTERTPTQAHEGGAAVLARAIALARTVAETANVTIEAVGIGAGGQLDYRTGVVLSATDILPGWAGTRLSESFAEAFDVPAFADNDVNAFAQGEHRFGGGVGATDCVYLALGTGVGGAIFTNGKLHRGKRGTGGELGHMFLMAQSYGKPVQTLEYFMCGESLKRNYLAMANRSEIHKELGLSKSEGLKTVDAVDPRTIGEIAQRDSNSTAREAVWKLGRHYLGMGLVSLANILDTERFVIGGGLSDLGELLLAPARATFAEHVLPLYRDTEIVAAKLGTNSSIVGAATVALTALETVPDERNTVA
ncbi:MAG: ROK family protein [Armatimonadetes bacterium]|nr:ROK family protein [Armatimonadota bacterium]